jgi:YfiR/HmsC-like
MSSGVPLLSWSFRLSLSIGFILSVALWADAAVGLDLASAIKATDLYKFAPFVEWPPGSFPSPTAPLVICIVGEDPFGDLIDRAVAGERMDRHAIVVRRMQVLDRRAGCNIVYAGGSQAQPTADILAALRDTPVLTVTDGSQSRVSGAIIRFVVLDNHVRFAIDDAQAARSGLVISSKLLSLAVSVRRRF